MNTIQKIFTDFFSQSTAQNPSSSTAEMTKDIVTKEMNKPPSTGEPEKTSGKPQVDGAPAKSTLQAKLKDSITDPNKAGPLYVLAESGNKAIRQVWKNRTEISSNLSNQISSSYIIKTLSRLFSRDTVVQKQTQPTTDLKPEIAKTEDKNIEVHDPITKNIQPSIDLIKAENATSEDIQSAIRDIVTTVADAMEGASDVEKRDAIAEALVSTLKEIGKPKDNPLATSLVSFALGQVLLNPQNKNEGFQDVEHWITKGTRNPTGCAEDLWRAMPRIKIYNNSDLPIIDGTKIPVNSMEQKSLGCSQNMRETINLLFKHVSQTDQELIPLNEMGNNQQDAANLGNGLAERLSAKLENNPAFNDKPKEKIAENMLKMFSLGAQELFTQPANSTIPTEWKPQNSKGNFQVAELTPGAADDLAPLKYGRDISIRIRDDGGLDYILEQPITFKSRGGISSDLLGTCRMQTIFSFDKDMKCISQTQEVKAAEVEQK